MEILCAALSTEKSELLCLSKTHGRLHLAAVLMQGPLCGCLIQKLG